MYLKFVPLNNIVTCFYELLDDFWLMFDGIIKVWICIQKNELE